ncbi:DUF3885 domain-containing protein [Streptomyces sp. NPDC002817]|uniref:DUF3885 domain-containing protein n=1 Tax=Streptomyces sp. NPDC088357 TaxID=3154655 RepID=UPI003435D005
MTDAHPLTELWRQRRPSVAHTIRSTYPDCWASPREALHPGGGHWWTEPNQQNDDPEVHTFVRLYAARHPWAPGRLDELLRAVADDTLGGVFVCDTELRRIHHPYDGGADVILTTAAERDRLRDLHRDRLSSDPGGM